VWISGTYAPIFDADGNVEAVIKIATDITAPHRDRADCNGAERPQRRQSGTGGRALGRGRYRSFVRRFHRYAAVSDSKTEGLFSSISGN
jgi:hypothetical protein